MYLSSYAKFTDKYEMDEAANRHLSANWNDLNGTDRAVLDMIRRYSVKHGAAHLKADTIANTIQKSVATVRRAIRKLEALRIIERVPFIRRVLSGRGANIYAILPVNDHAEMNSRSKAVEATESIAQEPKIENEPLSFKSYNLTPTEDTYKRGLRVKMPAYIYDLLEPYLNTSDMHEAYGAMIRGKAKIDNTITFESHEGLFSDEILSVINAYKRGKVRSIPAVLYAAVRDTTAQIYRQKHYTIPNWLDDVELPY